MDPNEIQYISIGSTLLACIIIYTIKTIITVVRNDKTIKSRAFLLSIGLIFLMLLLMFSILLNINGDYFNFFIYSMISFILCVKLCGSIIKKANRITVWFREKILKKADYQSDKTEDDIAGLTLMILSASIFISSITSTNIGGIIIGAIFINMGFCFILYCHNVQKSG